MDQQILNIWDSPRYQWFLLHVVYLSAFIVWGSILIRMSHLQVEPSAAAIIRQQADVATNSSDRIPAIPTVALGGLPVTNTNGNEWKLTAIIEKHPNPVACINGCWVRQGDSLTSIDSLNDNSAPSPSDSPAHNADRMGIRRAVVESIESEQVVLKRGEERILLTIKDGFVSWNQLEVLH